MLFISLTRLRLRSIRFLPLFALDAIRSQSQVSKAAGFLQGAVLRDHDWTFWTLTAWDTEESMGRYMSSGAHKRAMPHLLEWCDEASVAHWSQTEDELPSWDQADQRMREEGRVSKVKHPSPRHASLSYRPPRTSGGLPIKRA